MRITSEEWSSDFLFKGLFSLPDDRSILHHKEKEEVHIPVEEAALWVNSEGRFAQNGKDDYHDEKRIPSL